MENMNWRDETKDLINSLREKIEKKTQAQVIGEKIFVRKSKGAISLVVHFYTLQGEEWGEISVSKEMDNVVIPDNIIALNEGEEIDITDELK